MHCHNYNASKVIKMAHHSKLTERGQTTVPTDIRQLLHAKPGDTLEYDVTEQGVILRVKQANIDDVLNKHLGAFGGEAQNEEETIRRQREARGWDENDAQLFEDWADE